MITVSNTSPINYLILIEQIDLLPALFQEIVIPQVVYDELSDEAAPHHLKTWLANRPEWLKVIPNSPVPDATENLLDPGELAAIGLAQFLNADLLLLDDVPARRAAIAQGIPITGTLGVLGQAAIMKLVDLPSAIANLRQTSFWVSEPLLERLLERFHNQ